MPRRHLIKLDKYEPSTHVGTTLPESIVAFLDDQSRRTLVSRASFVRAAIIEKLDRDGRLAGDDDAAEVAA